MKHKNKHEHKWKFNGFVTFVDLGHKKNIPEIVCKICGKVIRTDIVINIVRKTR